MEMQTGEYFRRANSDFLPIHYHYLMFASHEIGAPDDAIKYAKTYLMFHPDNEAMRERV